MIVHRLLDAFFRTLDAVDAVRDRVDRVLGKEPRPDPWAVEWPPADGDAAGRPEAEPEGEHKGEEPEKVARKNGEHKNGASDAQRPVAAKRSAPAKPPAASKASDAATGKVAKKSAAAKPRPVSGRQKGSRKGSVDRSGKDFDSPRAKAIWEYVRDNRLGVVTEEAMLDGKKVLARVLWALSAAEAAGSELGLTTADASALLHLAARMEVYATNIGRACRDHPELITESDPDGRSKRYRLSAKGKALAVDIPTEKP